ncbi:hypothetical protein FACS1894123_12140 [Bacteroidia bacterium]|nr:hypothetical protein FACS1894123_12140 [Bacteroidia bacterium]
MATAVTTASETRQYEAYLNKPYAEAMDTQANIACMHEENGEYETFNAMRLLRVEQQVNALDMKLAGAEKEKTRNYLLLALAGCLLLLAALGIWIYYSRELVRKNQQWAGVATFPKHSISNKYGMFYEKETSAPDETEKLLMNEIETLMADGLYKNQDLTLDILAKKTGTNPTYISKTISRCTGKNFRTCINEYRVKEAIRILSDDGQKNHSIDDLAFESGFNDRKTFHRVFKKMTGLSPADFRKNGLG